MGVLRQTIQREVLDILDKSIFTSSDFKVIFGDPDKNEYMIFIKFSYNEKYFYAISKRASGVAVIRTPGNFEEKESSNFSQLGDAFAEINNWCTEVRNELKAALPLYGEIDKLRDVIEEHIKGKESSDEFTVEEIYNLRKKFDDLESRVINLEKDKIVTETQLHEFMDGIKQVKSDLEYYPKQTWVQTASNKLVRIVMSIGKTKEGRELITDGAKKLLGFE